MKDEKVLTEKTKELIVKAADDAVKLPFYLEPFDALVFKLILNVIDKKASEVIPDVVDQKINQGITLVFDKQADEGAKVLGEALAIVVDIPYVSEETEVAIATDGLKFLLNLIIKWAKAKK